MVCSPRLQSHRGRLVRAAAIAGMGLVSVALLAPSFAAAVPRTPELLGTHPSSPGISLSPRLYGTADEVITTVFDPQPQPDGPFADGEEGTVAIYSTPDCSGPALISGGSSEFEGSGISVTVLPDSITTFYATNEDASGVSSCSAGITYRQVEDPPAPAVVTGVTPASPADNNFPLVSGSAEADSTVKIFTNASCSGSPLATAGASIFSGLGIQVSVPDNSTTTFYALASWAELPASCSSTSATYQEITVAAPPPPEQPPAAEDPGPGSQGGTGVAPARPVAPKIHTVPGGRSSDSKPLVAGKAPGSTEVDVFRNSACSGKPAASVAPTEFSSGFRLEVAENAVTRFYARSSDAAGNLSDCSEEAVYVEDSAPPLTRITFGPGVKTRKRAPVFRFTDLSGDPPGTSFLCKLDRGPWRPCQTPWRLSHLRVKAHVAMVRAIDAAGNEEAVPAKRRFKVIARRDR
jgi:hypothetical protein